MEELKSSTKVLLVSAAIMVFILISGPFGYKSGFIELMPSLASLMVALLGSVLILIVAILLVIVSMKKNQTRNRNMLALAILMSLVPILVMAPQIIKGRSVPAIHDITTDMVNPPTFEAVVALRTNALNGLEYGSDALPAEELSALQQAAYPNIKPLESSLSVAEAVLRAEALLADQGLEIVATDTELGRVEATATTFWFGFKDDLVVRITPTATGSRIDLRSVSRVGQSDVGANAARIEKFLAAF